MVDGRHGEGNQCRVDYINQWSVLDSHISYAREQCPLNTIHNCSRCQSQLPLLNWSSRQWLMTKGTFNLPQERLWGFWSCPWCLATLPYSGSL
jgi:hypothetical protein